MDRAKNDIKVIARHANENDHWRLILAERINVLKIPCKKLRIIPTRTSANWKCLGNKTTLVSNLTVPFSVQKIRNFNRFFNFKIQ